MGACTLSLIVAVAVPTAEAQEIQKVELTANGPKRALPLMEEFYLTGAVKPEDMQVQAVFVRYSFPIWGGAGSTAKTCRTLAPALSAPDYEYLFSPSVFGKKVRDIWGPPPAKIPDPKQHNAGATIDNPLLATFQSHAGDLVYLPAPWKRDEALKDKEKSFAIHVEKSPFFRTGARYCMFVYKRNKTVRADKKAIVNAIGTFGTNLSACLGKPSHEVETCKTEAQKTFGDSIAAITKNLKGVDKRRLERVARDELYKAASKLRRYLDSPGTLKTELAGFSTMNVAAAALPEIDYVSVHDSTLGKLLIDVLVAQGSVIPQIVAGADGMPGSIRYFRDKDHEITDLGLLAGGVGFRFTSNKADAAKGFNFKVGLHKLKLPGTALTIEDLLEFRRGRLPWGEDYVEPDVVKDEIVLEHAKLPEVDEALVEKIQALEKWVTELRTSIRKLGEDPIHPTDVSFKAWILETVRRPTAAEITAAAQSARAKELNAPSDDDLALSLAGNQLSRLATALQETGTKGFLAWKSARDRATVNVVKLVDGRYINGPIGLNVALDQDAFFTQYVTPAVGYINLFTDDGGVSSSYVGVQVSLWPNPINDPMWSNGLDDLRRLFGLEVGISTSKSLGADGRYSGFDGALPPAFMGVYVQPIPYVTVSAGGALMGVRRSTLDEERWQNMLTPYVAVAVEANVPDVVRALSSKSKATVGGVGN